MAIDINIPSQVKSYANLAGFPATGSLKTIFIAEDTNKTYRWTGSAYVEISASQATAWGAITGTLSNQTDLQTALNAKQDSLGFTAVPTTRTLTINGTTQDLSADRTFTISTGITIGTTAITSGTVGRVLFEGAGNVVSESANLTFDTAATKLQLGILTPTGTTTPAVLSLGATFSTNAVGSSANIKLKIYDDNTATGIYGIGLTANLLEIHSPNTTGIFSGNGATRTQVFSINTAGSLFGSTTITATTAPFVVALGGTFGSNIAGSVANLKLKVLGSNSSNAVSDYGFGISSGLFEFSASDAFGFFTGNSLLRTERMRIFATGNVGINTTTDAGFRLDVNGTARVSGVTLIGSSLISASAYPLQVVGGAGGSALFSNTTRTQALNINLTTAGETRIYVDYFLTGTDQKLILGSYANRANQLVLNTTGNVSIGTTTDAGFKLDVNGTARVATSLEVGGTGSGSLTTSVVRCNFLNTANNSFSVIQFQAANGNATFFQSVSIGSGANPLASAQLEVTSTTKGFLPPRQTQAQRTAIASPAVGLIVYQTDLVEGLYIYKSTGWQFIA